MQHECCRDKMPVIRKGCHFEISYILPGYTDAVDEHTTAIDGY